MDMLLATSAIAQALLRRSRITSPSRRTAPTLTGCARSTVKRLHFGPWCRDAAVRLRYRFADAAGRISTPDWHPCPAIGVILRLFSAITWDAGRSSDYSYPFAGHHTASLDHRATPWPLCNSFG